MSLSYAEYREHLCESFADAFRAKSNDSNHVVGFYLTLSPRVKGWQHTDLRIKLKNRLIAIGVVDIEVTAVELDGTNVIRASGRWFKPIRET
jgi:hypothetical protein